MLTRFAQDRRPRPSYPFIRLQSDDIWLVNRSDELTFSSGGDALISSLNEVNPTGGFNDEFIDRSTEKFGPNWHDVLITDILQREFSPSLHEDIRDALGLEDNFGVTKSRRDPDFRNRVLDAYNAQCAICGYSARLQDNLVGIEAAHIKWFSYGGPDEIRNGLALCSLHHKLFDLGAIGISDNLRVVVSPSFSGFNIKSFVLDFENKEIFIPRQRSIATEPDLRFIQWQRSQVFKSWT